MLGKLNGTASVTWGDLKAEVSLKKAVMLALSFLAIVILATVFIGAIIFSIPLLGVIMHIVVAAALLIGPYLVLKDKILVKIFGEEAINRNQMAQEATTEDKAESIPAEPAKADDEAKNNSSGDIAEPSASPEKDVETKSDSTKESTASTEEQPLS